MTEIGDLVLRLGRLAFDDPAWTPARGTQARLRDPAWPTWAGALVPVIHQTADALAQMAAGDLAAMTRPENDIPHDHAPRLVASRLELMGVKDPGLLLRAAAVDRAAAAVARDALRAASPDTPDRYRAELPEQARAVAERATADATEPVSTTPASHPRRDSSHAPARTTGQRHRDREASRHR
jgi:hypothetical protein